MIQHVRRDRVAVLTLDRPDKHNALNVAICGALRSAFDTALTDGARAIVLTGNGPSFCAGADLNEVYSSELVQALRDLLRRMVTAPVPVVAAVNGPAIGGGLQLVIASDFRVIAPAARFGIPPAKLGVAVDPWTIRRLVQVAGDGTARALLLAAEQVDAAGALACGLADREGGLEEAVAWAQGMAELAPLTLAYTKQVLNEDFDADLDPRHRAAFDACWASEDREEGRLARAERRPPIFQGK